jgi:hypothetical protein
MADYRLRQLGPEPFAEQIDQIASTYWRALCRLRRRWPDLDLADPRGQP